jgi:hypothetical protein
MHLPRALAAAATLVSVAPVARAGAFAPGEETVFQVRYLNLPTGEGRIMVGQAEGDVWPVIFQVRTEGIASLVDIREHLVTYWDVSANLTRGSDLRAYEVGDYHVDSARFDRVNHRATVSVQRNGRRKVDSFAVPPGVQDLTSAFMWLRLQPLAPGQHLELPVCAGRKHFTLVADVLGREAIETPAGTFQTVKVQVRTALEGKFSTRRDTFMWLSDDTRHVLVRASADFAVGSMVATLKAYRPGNEIAAR